MDEELTDTVWPGASAGQVFDEAARTITVSPPGRPAHSFQYDEALRLLSYTPPDVDGADHRWGWLPDSDGALTRRSFPGRTVPYIPFDTAGRVTMVGLERGMVNLSYHPNGLLSDALMPAAEVGEPRQTLHWELDGSLLTSVTFGGLVTGDITFTYDPDRWTLSSEQVGTLLPIEYSYDDDGLLIGAGLATQPLVITRRPDNGLATAVQLGAVATAQTLDTFGRVTDWSTAWSGGAFDESITYADNANRIVCRTLSTDLGIETRRYVYDTEGRLAEVYDACIGGTRIAEYQYDLNGNRTQWTEDFNTHVGVYDDQDRLVRLEAVMGGVLESYSYNGQGQLEIRTNASGSTAYSYDETGALLRVDLPDTRVIEYRMDASGRRVQRRVDGAIDRSWLYRDGLRPIAQLDSAGNVTQLYVYASRSNAPDLIIVPAGPTYRIVHDHLGSVRRVVDVATGAVVQAIDYSAFGTLTRDTNPGFQPFGFAGGLFDADTGLVRFGARDYDPFLGRWTAKDPILFAGGSNVYTYAQNDPVNFIDPSGLIVDTIFDVAFIGYDIGVIINDNILGDCDNLGWNALSLAGDVAGLLIPFATGLGAAVRAGRATRAAVHADDAVDAVRAADRVADSARACFAAGEPVHGEDGLVAIERIEAGDRVWTRNESSGEVFLAHVTQTFVTPDRPILNLELVDASGRSDVLRTTGEHPFRIAEFPYRIENTRWIEARDLRAGDHVLSRASGWLQVGGATWAQEREDVFNFEVEGTHTYFVGEIGAWVHNACTGGPARFIADDAGNIIDTHATPPGRWIQPDRSATDILQQRPHPGPDRFATRTHTHPAEVHVNPNNPAQRSVRLGEPRPVTGAEMRNIAEGRATRSRPRGR